VFSIARQAVLLGYLPRVQIFHTSADAMGQIYVPVANTLLMICTMGLVVGFQTSSALAGAYGVAVTTTMLFTTVMLFVVSINLWRWHVAVAVMVCGSFLLFNGAFTVAAYMKIPDGGWFPLVIGFLMYLVMMTWRQGRRRVRERLGTMTTLPLDIFAKNVTEGSHQATRVPGTAVYLYSAETGTPRALLHNLRYNKVLHEQVIVLTMRIEEQPHVKREERLEIQDIGKGVHRVFARYGFMESPDIPDIMTLCEEKGLKVERHTAMFVLARENIKMTNKPGLMRWQQSLFMFMSRNAHEASGFFNIPVNQVVELGIQVEV
jgi:KUP system potassium uptake protein